jgi:P4 family phage/plasmid primase-like protien
MTIMNAATSMDITKINLDEARKAHAILHSPGHQVEIRILLKDGGAMTGRFEGDAKMFEWLKDADDPGVEVVWWSIQQLIPEPATNDLQRRKGSGNNSVARRNWIIVDIDPVRETDPASETEIDAAIQKTQEIVDWLAARNIGPCLATMTGNGYHLYFPTDGWANDEHHNNMAKVFVGMLDSKFSDNKVKVDTASANPGRLGKIPGCISRKGEEKEGRRYRTVEIESTADAPALTTEDVKAVAEAEGYPIQPTRAPRKSGGLDPDFDIYDFAEWCGVTVGGEFEKNGCTYYALEECPMAGHRHRGTLGKTCFIIGDSIGFECFSDDCEGLGIGDVLRKFSGEKGRYSEPLFLEPDMSDKFPVDDIDDITETIAEPLPAKETTAEVVESVAKATASAPDEDKPESVKIEGEIYLTDLGNAKRLVKTCGNDIRYCFHTKKWYVWTGRRWAVDDKGAIYKKAKRVVQSILAEAAEIQDPEVRKAFIQHERVSEGESRIKAMVSLAQSEGEIPVRLKDFDANPNLLNTVSGTIDLSTGKVGPHRRSDMATKMSPVVYDPEAKCPIWERFLNQVTAGDKALQDYLQRCVGYSLTGETKEHALFLLYGKGANGKSTFLEVVRHVIGDYAQTADFGSFMVSKNQTVRNDIAKLNGARLVTATESESGKRMSESVVKQLTGGDTVTARFLYSEHFEFVPQFKLWLGTNHKPKIVGADDGIWRRIRLIPFTVQFQKEQQDKDLPKKLKAEAAGILNWALEGLRQWQKMGLAEPETVTDATSEYRADQDVLQHFIDARCKTGVGERVKGSSLYGSYKLWAELAGEFIMSERDFGNAMSDRGYSRYRKSSERGWEGIALTTEEPEKSEYLSETQSAFDELEV